MSLPSADEFFGTMKPENENAVPRDHKDRPMIAPVPGDEHLAYKSGKHKGLVPYARPSSYGAKLEDPFYLTQWKERQVARAMGVLIELGKIGPGPTGGLPRNPLVEPSEKADKDAWNAFVSHLHDDVVKSSAWAELGTAIHYGTELVDLGESLDNVSPQVRERAEAYWRARQEWGWVPTSVEQFGVEDVYHVAGTRDRSMRFLGKHVIGDVKTSGSLDFSGLKFAVQLAIYAHSKDYDPATKTRTPIDVDLEEAWIIHVHREENGPVTLHRVDIAGGWRHAGLVAEILAARNFGRGAIEGALDSSLAPLARCTTRAELQAFMLAHAHELTPEGVDLANDLWTVLP